MRRRVIIALFIFAIASSDALRGQTATGTARGAVILQNAAPRTADPIKRGLKLTDFPRTLKLTDNVYTYEDFHSGDEKFTTTNMFVVTGDGVVVADGQGSLAETKGLVDAIAKVTSQPIKFVVICSDHGDHTAGDASFPAGVTYIIHPTSKAVLDASRNGWKPPANSILVSDRYSFKLGFESIDVFFLGRAHTGGDLSVAVPRQKILFLSETFLNRVFPAMRSAYPADWLRALDKAEAMRADVYVPGHGFTELGPVSREELAAYHNALQAVIAEARRLHNQGLPVEDAIKQANWGEYAAWTLASSQGPIAIRRVYDEMDGKLK
jgi:glyoxylase-like metal-dependent hydrolase (beta-lactamase superfamily II)